MGVEYPHVMVIALLIYENFEFFAKKHGMASMGVVRIGSGDGLSVKLMV